MLGVSEGTSKSQVHKARMRIRAYLAQRERQGRSERDMREQLPDEFPLADFVDGRLDARRRAGGRAASRGLRRTAARSSPTCAPSAPPRSCSIGDEPPAELLDAPAGRRRRRTGPSRPPARVAEHARGAGASGWRAAAALILATVIGLLPLLRRSARGSGDTGRRVDAEGSALGRVGGRGVRGRREALPEGDRRAARRSRSSDTGELDPQVAAVLQKNLTVIDQAISESRAALKSQPASSQRAGRPVRRPAHQGGAAAADGRVDQRNAQGQSGRGRAPDSDPVAVTDAMRTISTS